jgi:TPR repeat protein/putative methionine-R-sulfoxide reductase with GAF domain
MASINSAFPLVSPNRRRRVRHKIQTPAYATFTAESQGAMLDLHEILDISEDGVAIQCHSPLEVQRRVNLCLDLADCADHIYTTGEVVWSNASGRAGLHFPALAPESLTRLREWLFVNVMAGVANGETQIAALPDLLPDVAPRPNFTDTLAAVTAVQRQVEALGSDLAAALKLIAERSHTLVRASGAAIALAESDPDFMVCRASSGQDAPPVGARLQVGSGFSGECVKTGILLRCDDAELDGRVDRESCRALGIRSILAVPVRVGQKSFGLLEAFSSQPNTFSETDGGVLQRLADTVLAAVNRAARAEDLPQLGAATAVTRFAPTPGSVLFASTPGEEKKMERSEEQSPGGISLPRSHLILLICAAAVIALVLGYNLAPLIQSKLQERGQIPIQTVFASSQPPKSVSLVASFPAVETASSEQLQRMAEQGDPAAENALGLRYFQGDEKNKIVRDERQAFRWFLKAADHGNLSAQAKLGLLYWGGRGVNKDVNQAYFWTVLARARGDRENKDLAVVLASSLTRSQVTVIEQQADLWLQQHLANWKPSAGH